MTINFDELTNFWLRFNKKGELIESSDFFKDCLKENILNFLEFTQPKINKVEPNFEKLLNKIIQFTDRKKDLKFRATGHVFNNSVTLIAWPALKKLEEIKVNKLQKQMLHPACYLTDTLILKDVLQKTQIKFKKLELARIEAEKEKQALEKVSSMKSNFLASMSHEIRTPMNGLIGMLQLMENTKLTKEQTEILKTVRNCGDNLLVVINDILDYSQIENGSIKIDSNIFDIKEIVQTCYDLHKPSADEKNLKYSLNVNEEIYVNADASRTSQILSNLISNAIKFTDEGEVSVSLVKENIPEKSEKVRIIIEDQGIGIKDEYLPYLFNAFTQQDDSIARNFGGTGLGLSISKRLANEMNSEIRVHSVENEGTTFELIMEIVEKPADSEKTVNSKYLIAKNKEFAKNYPFYILIVEDNPINAKLLSKMLEKLGYSPKVATSGKKALQELKKNSYDLILMDLQMPEMDGIQTTTEVRKLKDYSQIKIIGVSANVSETKIQLALNSGMDAYIMKPIIWEEIMQSLIKHSKSS
jgi:signal transduction histidine kinase/CheY-like chemotaxis protein